MFLSLKRIRKIKTGVKIMPAPKCWSFTILFRFLDSKSYLKILQLQSSIPIYHLQKVFLVPESDMYPNFKILYMLLYTEYESSKIRQKIKCTTCIIFKMQWEPCRVKPRKCWLPDMTEKMLTGMLSLNTIKQIILFTYEL